MILIFDCILVPVVSISANAKYLLSGATVASKAVVLERYVLNNSVPFASYRIYHLFKDLGRLLLAVGPKPVPVPLNLRTGKVTSLYQRAETTDRD